MVDNFSDIFSDAGSDHEDSVIRKIPDKTVRPFSDYSKNDSSDDGNNDIKNLGGGEHVGENR